MKYVCYIHHIKTQWYQSLKVTYHYNRIANSFNYSKSPNFYSQLFTFSNDNDIVESAR